MQEYRQLSIFDELIEDENEENFVDEIDGFTLVQVPNDDKSFEYKVFDDYGVLVTKWKSNTDCLSMKRSQYMSSANRTLFMQSIKREKDKIKKELDKDSIYNDLDDNLIYEHPEDDYDDYEYEEDDETLWDKDNYYGGYFSGYRFTPRKGTTGYLNKLNKSNTLVIHCADSSTDMLSQIYDGKGWDVLRDGNIDKDELHQLIESHDRLICLGHGTSSGLINAQGGGYVIGYEEAPLLKDKNLFVIWCNATDYFKNHNIGHGMFITKNVPSEVWEARAVGFNVSAQYILENITYWSKCCADVAEQALSGDVAGAVKKAREAYQAKYGNDDNPDQKGVTDYNTDAIQVQP